MPCFYLTTTTTTLLVVAATVFFAVVVAASSSSASSTSKHQRYHNNDDNSDSFYDDNSDNDNNFAEENILSSRRHDDRRSADRPSSSSSSSSSGNNLFYHLVNENINNQQRHNKKTVPKRQLTYNYYDDDEEYNGEQPQQQQQREPQYEKRHERLARKNNYAASAYRAPDLEENNKLDEKSLLPNVAVNNKFEKKPSQQQQQQQQQEKLPKINKFEQKSAKVLLDLNFSRDFTPKFDPRQASSLFQFAVLDSTEDLLLDNAGFMTVGNAAVDMVSMPFGRWLSRKHGLLATAAVYDATVATKQLLTTTSTNEVLSVKLKLNCRTINVELHKFPPEAVTNATEDPRLASCGMYLTDLTFGTGLEFAILLTKHTVWATYSRQLATRQALRATYAAFDVYRPIGVRPNERDFIEVQIQIDSRQKIVKYLISDELVWTVAVDTGVLSSDLLQDENNRIVSYSPSPSPSSVPSQPLSSLPEGWTLSLINAHKMDIADPNKIPPAPGSINNLALVRLSSEANFYSDNVEFVDEKSERFSSLYGQGCIAGLKQLTVELLQTTQQEKNYSSSAPAPPVEFNPADFETEVSLIPDDDGQPQQKNNKLMQPRIGRGFSLMISSPTIKRYYDAPAAAVPATPVATNASQLIIRRKEKEEEQKLYNEFKDFDDYNAMQQQYSSQRADYLERRKRLSHPLNQRQRMWNLKMSSYK